jgi:hypothetical protein
MFDPELQEVVLQMNKRTSVDKNSFSMGSLAEQKGWFVKKTRAPQYLFWKAFESIT